MEEGVLGTTTPEALELGIRAMSRRGERRPEGWLRRPAGGSGIRGGSKNAFSDKHAQLNKTLCLAAARF